MCEISGAEELDNREKTGRGRARVKTAARDRLGFKYRWLLVGSWSLV